MPHTVFLVIPYRPFFPFGKPVRLAFSLLVVVLLVALGSRAADFTFAQITDIHLSNAQTEADLRSTLKALANLGEPVDFVLVTGDISEMGRSEEFQRCKSLLDSSGFRYYVLLGNHDVRWSTCSLEELAGLLPGVPHFAFMHKGVQFIGLNTALPLEAWGDLSPAEQRWLAEHLAAVARNVPRLIFTHHPVFHPDRDFTADAFRFLKILNGYNVRLVSAGHGHRYRRWFLNDVPFVMAPAVLHSRGFLLFRVHGDSLLCEARLADSDSLLGGFRLALRPEARQAAPPLAGVRVSTSSDSLWLHNLTDFDTVLVHLDGGPWQRTPVRKASVVLPLPVKVEGEHTVSLRLLTATDSLWQREFRFPVGKSLLWKLALNARVQAPLALAHDRLFVVTGNGQLTALDPATGRLLWQQTLSGSVIKGLAANGNVVVVATTKGMIEAFRTRDGAPLWRASAQEPLFAQPALSATNLYVGTSRGNLLALRLRDGHLVWRAGPFGMIQTPPALEDTLLLLGSWDGTLRALSARTGHTVWETRPAPSPYCAPATATPAVHSGHVFFCAAPAAPGKPGFYTVALEDGRILWTWPCACHYASPLLCDSVVVTATLQGHLVAFKTGSMQVAWDRKVATAFFDASPVGTGGILYSVGLRGEVAKLSSEDGRVLAFRHIGNDFILATPAVRDDTLWVADLEGNVFSLKMAPDPHVPGGH